MDTTRPAVLAPTSARPDAMPSPGAPPSGGRFRRSLDIAKESLAVLRRDRTLVAFPLIGLATVLALAGMVVAIGIATPTGSDTSGGSAGLDALVWVVIAVGYVAVRLVITFLTAALTHAAHEAMDGHDTSVGASTRAALGRFPQILGWSILAGTLGLALQLLSDRGFIGQIVASVLSLAWQVLTFLAVPVIVFEGLGPVSNLKRSTELLRGTWGENVIGQVGIGLVVAVVALPALVLAAALYLLSPAACVVAVVVWVILVSLAGGTLKAVYGTALYRYATTGSVTGGFSADAITGAFAPRAGGRGRLR